MSSAFGLQDRIVIVTVSQPGLGRASAFGVAQLSAQVVVTDIDMDTAQATSTEITERGQRALAYRCDSSRQSHITHLFETVDRAVGPVNVQVNNAGVGNHVRPKELTEQVSQHVLDDPQFGSDVLTSRFLTGNLLGRLGEPEDLVGPVVFLASDASAMVTGMLLPVQGGNLALNAGGSHTW